MVLAGTYGLGCQSGDFLPTEFVRFFHPDYFEPEISDFWNGLVEICYPSKFDNWVMENIGKQYQPTRNLTVNYLVISCDEKRAQIFVIVISFLFSGWNKKDYKTSYRWECPFTDRILSSKLIIENEKFLVSSFIGCLLSSALKLPRNQTSQLIDEANLVQVNHHVVENPITRLQLEIDQCEKVCRLVVKDNY